MGRWTCKCGQYMNDHKAPDENCYLAFADVVWDQIETDVGVGSSQPYFVGNNGPFFVGKPGANQ